MDATDRYLIFATVALEGVQAEPPRPAPQPDDAPLLRWLAR